MNKITNLKPIKALFAISIIFIVVFFVFLRLYRIDHTLEFWGDIGRDNEKLMEWYQTGKPPLNGPNTILKIVNQSPWFFYVNYPVFLITKSPLTMTITVTGLMISAFILGLLILKKKKQDQIIFSLFFFFITIHPLIVIQQRTPWNPSFSIPFLIFGIASYLYLRSNFSIKVMGAGIISLCIALGMTYSLFPVIALLYILLLLTTPKRQRGVFIVISVISLFIVFLPNIIFEIKSNFFLLRRFPGGINIPPVSSSFLSKIYFTFSTVFLGSEGTPFALLKSIFVVAIVMIHLYTSIYYKNKNDRSFLFFLSLAVTGTIITLLMPFQQGYYLFGVILLWLLTFAHMRKVYVLLLLIGCIIFWYQPVWRGEAARPIAELDRCAREFCSQFPGVYYVSANAWHGMHSAHDHAFFINRNGCKARDIVSHPEWETDKMIVVADRSIFLPYKSSYYELEQFGPYEVKQYYSCSSDIQYWLLLRK